MPPTTTTTAAPPKLRKYRLLAGGHIQKGPDGKDEYYLAPDVFLSKHDLLRFNAPNFPPKFELAHQSDPVSVPRNKRHLTPAEPGQADDSGDEGAEAVSAPTPSGGVADTLRSMSLEELRRYADEEGVKLPGLAKTREKVLEYLLGRL